MALLNGVKVVSLIGRQGAGKTTVGRLLARRLWTAHIEASTCVRDLYGDLPRDQMPLTNARTATEPNWLGDLIAEKADELLLTAELHYPHVNDDIIVVTGVREQEVHDTLEQNHKGSVLPIFIWTEERERYRRLKELGKVTNFNQFERQDRAEGKIGLDKLIEDVSQVVRTDLTTTPDEIVDLIYQIVDTRTGVK